MQPTFTHVYVAYRAGHRTIMIGFSNYFNNYYEISRNYCNRDTGDKVANS